MEYCGIITDIFKLLLKPSKDTIDYKTVIIGQFIQKSLIHCIGSYEMVLCIDCW